MGCGLLFELLLLILKFYKNIPFFITKGRSFFVVLLFDNFHLLKLNISSFMFKLLNYLWNLLLGLTASPHFIKDIKCFVREFSVGDVAVSELYTQLDDFIRVRYLVKCLVAVSDVGENLNGLSNGGWVHHYLLEATLQSSVLFK